MTVTVSRVAEEGVMVRKRDGGLEPFNREKLEESVRKAVLGAGLKEDDAADLLGSLLSELGAKMRGAAESGAQITTRLISDTVERSMIERLVGNPLWEEAAKRYVLARLYNHVHGKGGWRAFDPVDLRLTYNALKVLEARYLLREPESQRFRETPSMLFRRVARFLASVEEKYGKSPEEVRRIEEEFYRILSELRFMPNSPTLMNAGTKLGVLSACFVIPVRDAMTTPRGDGIMDAARATALIQQQGGGTGFDFSELRPEGDVVASTAGVASGPLSFMRLFDTLTEVIKQGGKRRGANMGILHVWHPDIEKFIKAKSGELKDTVLQNFNISVAVYDKFMEAVESGEEWPLINPRKTFLLPGQPFDSRYYAIVRARHSITEEWVAEYIIEELEQHGGSIPLHESLIITLDEAIAIAENEEAIQKQVDAKELFWKIVHGAWDSGDPGMIFIDEINRRHPTWYLGKIQSTNPCGEEPLLEWENCNLGSINLERYVVDGGVDWEGLARDVRVAVRFLDNVIDANRHPLEQIGEANRRTRKVGLGVMGWARMLVRLGIRYDSVEAVVLGWRLAEWIAYNAYLESVDLAREKGVFPAWDAGLYRPVWRTLRFRDPGELLRLAGLEDRITDERVLRILRDAPRPDWEELEKEIMRHGLRNAALLSIAPTGSISIIAGASSSIEPLFALAFMRYVSVGTFMEVDRLFLEYLAKYELDEPELIKEIAKTGSIAHIPYLPRTLRRLFRTAHDIDPEWHVLHQAAWQAWIDAAVSKTVNLRHEEPPETVWRIYRLAWKLGCKGITVYRDKSKKRQVIEFGLKTAKEKARSRLTLPKRSEAKASPPPRGFRDAEAPLALRPREKPEKLGLTAMKLELEKKLEEAIRNTKLTADRVRIGKDEYIAVAEEYAGGCPTCDI